ncbi:MAG: efflux RND transporter periplasmic adaptor subunit [Kiritimatiellia bacterium]|nr:efflux RND transporter periplasmic adaptor subunit [Kiritimatiellia bacterium]
MIKTIGTKAEGTKAPAVAKMAMAGRRRHKGGKFYFFILHSALVRHSSLSDGGFCILPCVIAATILCLCGCGGKETKKSADEAVPVRCVRVEARDLKRTLDYASSIKAQNDALVYPKVTGKIIEKLKEEGIAVNKGETIAYVDRDEIGFKFEKSPVDSPLTGIIGTVYVDKGDSVSPQTPVAFVVNIDNVRVSLDVPEKYLPIMTLGQNADISVDACPGQNFAGKVSEISPIVDLQTRTAPIEIFIPNPGHKLTPGMFARVKLVLEEKKQIKLIPKEAVMGAAPDIIVYVVDGKIARQRKVKTGIRYGGEVEIEEGLTAGEIIVIMGQQRLRDGTEVVADEENLKERN